MHQRVGSDMSAVVQNKLAILPGGLEENRSRSTPIGAATAIGGNRSTKQVRCGIDGDASAAAAAANRISSIPAVGRNGAGANQCSRRQPEAAAGTAAAA